MQSKLEYRFSRTKKINHITLNLSEDRLFNNLKLYESHVLRSIQTRVGVLTIEDILQLAQNWEYTEMMIILGVGALVSDKYLELVN